MGAALIALGLAFIAFNRPLARAGIRMRPWLPRDSTLLEIMTRMWLILAGIGLATVGTALLVRGS